MRGRITAATLILVACSSNGGFLSGGKPNALSYAQYHSLEKGMTAVAILNAFGPPVDTLEQDGKVRGLTYYCEDAAGNAQQLRMVFDSDGRLENWALKSTGATPKREEPAEKTS